MKDWKKMGKMRRYQSSEDSSADCSCNDWHSHSVGAGRCETGSVRIGSCRSLITAYQCGRTSGMHREYRGRVIVLFFF